MSATVFGASLPTSNGVRVDRGGILFHSPPVFYLLCAVLWWSALLPKLNPFDAVYNLTFGGNQLTAFYLTLAPAPRRTAQAMAGMFALACGLLLHFGLSTAAYVLAGIFLAAVLALILGGFCLGSFVFHLLGGKGAFARQTLPWATKGTKGCWKAHDRSMSELYNSYFQVAS